MTATPTTQPPPQADRRPRVPKLALSIREAGQALSLSPRTVEDLVRLGQLPVVRVGRRVVLPVAGLRRWLEQETQNAGEGS